ncbi:ATP-dependent RNA helicase, putative [Ixodes scapularis]|uniref:RNA helicase n=1 Tax=Ixodes scapularis TaxID=6945 RepID=B7QDY6_IXOSC|nr:ATP-dependent RNA helicase, putative [Ixodes scapularis]|eukprot:XP_002413750.1 ATP-dependent RNA helicase, putative [Ixodes scapularis]
MPWTTQAATVQYEEDIWIEEEDNTPVVQCSYDADQRGQNRERTFGRGRSRPGWDNQPRRSDQSSNWRDSAGVGRGRSRQSSGGGGGGGDDSDVMVVPAKDVGKIIARFCKRDGEPGEEQPMPFIDWAKLIADSDQERERKWNSLPPIIKNFYIEDPEVAAMSPEQVAAFRLKNNNIVVNRLDEKEGSTPVPTNPVATFEQAFAHYPEIMNEIYKNKFEKPSPIQSQAWPLLLQGHDLIGIAQTGTGKTLAFLLPAMIHIDSQPVVCIYGGGNRREQIQTVNLGVEIVIATPGRLNDLVMNNIIDLKYVTFLILDEADRMLDMGFEPQIKKVLLDIRPDRQTVMTSATWPEGVRRLSQQYMSSPFQVFVGSLDLAVMSSNHQRLVDGTAGEPFYSEDGYSEAIGMRRWIFYLIILNILECASRVDYLSSDFILAGINCQSIHGDREQCDREQALEDLRDGTVKILIATDVAARGLDIKDITHIFNYDFPRNIEEYVHRVGRTGRAGRRGESITLVTRENWRQAKELIAILEEANQEVPQELYSMATRFEAWKKKRDEERPFGDRDRNGGGGGGGFRRGGGGYRNRW